MPDVRTRPMPGQRLEGFLARMARDVADVKRSVGTLPAADDGRTLLGSVYLVTEAQADGTVRVGFQNAATDGAVLWLGAVA